MAKKIINLDSFVQTGDVPPQCAGGLCPKILIDDNGDALVQGYVIDDATKAKMNKNEDEDIVFVPKNIIQDLIKHYK
jgi:hypothetical protein